MGMRLFGRCSTNPAAPAPNPDPSRWELLELHQFSKGYALKVRYLDCTNFEGVKVMVFEGRYVPGKRPLDPHFAERGGPYARFRPDAVGMRLAIALAKALGGDE